MVTVTDAPNFSWSKPAEIVKFAPTVCAYVQPTVTASNVEIMAAAAHVETAPPTRVVPTDSAAIPARMNVTLLPPSNALTARMPYRVVGILMLTNALIPKLNCVRPTRSARTVSVFVKATVLEKNVALTGAVAPVARAAMPTNPVTNQTDNATAFPTAQTRAAVTTAVVAIAVPAKATPAA